MLLTGESWPEHLARGPSSYWRETDLKEGLLDCIPPEVRAAPMGATEGRCTAGYIPRPPRDPATSAPRQACPGGNMLSACSRNRPRSRRLF